jgi:predicted MFS family arabinose efflux permease
LVTGLAIAPQGVIGFTADTCRSRLARRITIRRVLVLTGGVASSGLLILTQLPAGSGYTPLLSAVMLVEFATAGTAFGTIVTAAEGAADRDQGVVAGVINTSRQVGAAIGAELLPAVALAASRTSRHQRHRNTRGDTVRSPRHRMARSPRHQRRSNSCARVHTNWRIGWR